MNLKKFYSLIFFIIFITNYSYSYQWLYIQDPQNPWRSGPGTIEEAVIEVKPCGIYMQYQLSLTFSARNLGFTHSDTLEIQFNFDLPENSIVHDSWLLINNEMVRALILDKWTASNIYEETVNRRRDPSILYKNQGGGYQLRVFPMAGDESRQVKISYLVPADWGSKSVTAPLPVDLIRVSSIKPSVIKVIIRPDKNFSQPQILEFPETNFIHGSDSLFGNYLEAELPGSSVESNVNIAFKSPLVNGTFLSTYSSSDENFYQMAFLPSDALNLKAAKKVAVLIDYDASKSSFAKQSILSSVKSALISGLNAGDSVNIILSDLNILRMSEKWLPADSSTIENIFKDIKSDKPSNYSNMAALLANAIDFVKRNGNDGNILLISDADNAGDYKAANQLIGDLIALMDTKIPIHIVNYQDINYYYYWFGGRSYIGNEYFYVNLTRMTSGNYYSYLSNNNPPGIMISSAVDALSGFIKSFDLHTKLADGFCYARYNLTGNTSSTYLNRPILQVGKFQGNLPFIIEASGVYKTEPFSKSFSIDENSLGRSDSLSQEMWVGNYISFLENQSPSNDIVNEIVWQSVHQRILSIYSAFICLEPGREVNVCYDCIGNPDAPTTGIKKDSLKQNDSLSLAAYPNPFNSSTKILVNIPSKLKGNNISMKIFNILGQLIKTFDAAQFGNNNKMTLNWDGRNDYGRIVSSGTYIFVLNTGTKVQSTKLVLLK